MTLYQAPLIWKKYGFGALCTIVRSCGSTPRHVTSKMIDIQTAYPGTVGWRSVCIKEALLSMEERNHGC
jgi:hypothetical protein